MAQIVPKLNLNKTPANIETNSLVFAKNIRLDVDGSIHRDYGVFPMSICERPNTENLVNYNNILNRIISDIGVIITDNTNVEDYIITIYDRLRYISGKEIKNAENTIIARKGSYKIVGIIANSNEFYIFINGSYTKNVDSEGNETKATINAVICYDEKEDNFYSCNCNWSWSGGTITGCVVNNLLSEKILTIGEKDATKLVPLKCINLNTSSINDDEQIYTQTPNIPITNLNYIGSFNYSIPNGVYQFFVRYKIRENFYTDWFPASKELFAGNTNNTDTSFGTLRYVNNHRDSDTSFKFSVEHLFDKQISNYKSFQIGFILSHDDSVVARAWKHFEFNVDNINFDYNANDAYEIEVVDLLKSAYQLYDVGNIANFKNKLYVANYIETDFNENHQDLANKVGIEIVDQSAQSGYDGHDIIETTINGKKAISGLKIDETELLFSGESGLIKTLLTTTNTDSSVSIKDAIADAIGDNSGDYTVLGAKKYSIEIKGNKASLEGSQAQFKNAYSSKDCSDFTFDTSIQNIKVGGVYVNTNQDKEALLNDILSTIYIKNRYLNQSCVFIDDNGNESYQTNVIISRGCSYVQRKWVSDGIKVNENPTTDIIEPDTESITPIINGNIDRPNGEIIGDTGGHYEYTTMYGFYTQTISLRLWADRSKYKTTNTSLLLDYTTLIPYQKYKFYIHYVKQNGEITNGYYCNGKTGGVKEVSFKSAVDSVIYPKFTNIILPDGYVACFFSIVHVENNVATLFNIDTTNTNGEGNCMDINLGLIGSNDNLTIKQGYTNNENTSDINPDFPSVEPINPSNPNNNEIKTNTGKYYYSSDSSNIRYFGANGIIQFDKSSNISSDKVAYIVNEYKISDAEDVQLTKCTPFINPNSLEKEEDINVYSSFDDMNLLGFICEINPLDRARTITYYTDGSSVYIKKGVSQIGDGSGQFFQLSELKTHLLDTSDYNEQVTALCLTKSDVTYVYSNYNLNYLILSEDPVETYKTYYNNKSEDSNSNSANSYSLVLRLLKSLTMSSVYELPSMYKTYTRKTYSIYNTDSITEFNNTIRSSKLEGDEVSINIFKFDPNNYYNVPTNRGFITNVISVGDSILVHTQDSMFRFSGSNTLQSSDGEIQQTENNVFDTGVAEVFGSDFGFAGLQYKTDCIVTENGYIFFDRDSRIVYMYSGQGQINKISDSIEKLFRHRNIESIKFANDYYNNRFFLSIVFYETYKETENDELVVKRKYYPVTLSFNVSENVKSFVSLHDFYYNYAFNTKIKCYFLTADNQDICNISKSFKGCYTKLGLLTDVIYPQLKEVTAFTFEEEKDSGTESVNYNVNLYNSIVDIIDNTSYEAVKTLNAINWCGNKVSSEFTNIDNSNESTLNMIEEVNAIVPCKYIRIYSDTCMTPLCDCTRRSNDSSLKELSYPKYPFFNQGTWTFNYFRNILNAKGYKNPYSGDNNSLIEGKYFVVRFVFDSDFKLETLSLNSNIK